MAEETIVADEQNVEETEAEETETEEEEETTDEEKELLKQELAKAKADKEKWEARYKSTKKQEASKTEKPKETKTEVKDIDLDSLVEKKLMAIEEQREFIKTYGEDVFNEVKKIRDKHPTLSLNDAYKISPIAAEESKWDPSTYSMWGRPNAKVMTDSKSITLEQLSKLDKAAYRTMKDRIAKWEVTLKN